MHEKLLHHKEQRVSLLSTRTYGNITNPPLLFLHGFLGCKEDFEPLAQKLSENYYCICIDIPGHGDSPWTEDPLQAIRKTLLSISSQKIAAVGYSLGGRILLQLQEKSPELFSCVCIFSSHMGVDTPSERFLRREKEQQWIYLLKTATIEQFLEQWYNQPLFNSLRNKKELFTKTIEKRKHQDTKSLLRIYEKFRLSEMEPITAFSKDTFFFYGQYDTAYKDLYLKKIQPTNLEEISESGHAVHLENPLECARKIKQALTSGKI
ncbi:MAG: alpha/beta fold hydrolase [Chlamydiae bacterium]|nr:alpha/beta fold hydrolase [Chlamydiota bacterium]